VLIAFLTIPPSEEPYQLSLVDKLSSTQYKNWQELGEFPCEVFDARSIATLEDLLYTKGYAVTSEWRMNPEWVEVDLKEFQQ
jgi:hypothetical protein